MKNNCLLKCLAFFSFFVMVSVNALANIIRINGVTTAEVSEAYPNLFAPSGFTFSIWGLIYTLLIAYVIYQFGFMNGKKQREDWLGKVNGFFILSSIANTLWVFAWHFDQILISVFLIVSLLISLILMASSIRKEKLSAEEKAFVKWPFAVYFGWVTVAVIANVSVYLVSINWQGWGISPERWTTIMLFVGSVIGMLTTWWFDSVAYGLVIIWAYWGIYVKHTAVNGWAGAYPLIIGAVIVNLLVCSGLLVWKIWKRWSS